MCVLNELTLLARTSTAHGLLPGGQPLELHFMEFVVDGQPLGRTLGPFLFYEDATQEYVSVLVNDWPINSAAVDLDRLLGKQPDPSLAGRVAIYVCAECGDLGCGAVTAVVKVGTKHVVWRDIGYQNSYETFDQSLIFEGVGPFTFDYRSYASALETFRREVAES